MKSNERVVLREPVPATNHELVIFLVRLSESLISSGKLELGKAVRQSSRFASGSPSEFLHEAGLALRLVMTQGELHEEEKAVVSATLKRIEVAFKAVGGA